MAQKLALILRLSTTLTTVLFLAFIAQGTMSSLVDENDREPSTFMIQALSTEGGSAGDASQELWVDALIMDGRLLRWDSVKRSSNWQMVDKRGFGLPPSLSYKEVSQPGFLTFQGRSFLAKLQANRWSGNIRVEGDGRETQVVASKPLEGQERLIILEDPRVKPSVAVYFGALVLFGGLAYWFGPIRIERQHTLWLIFVLFVLHALFWANQCIGTTNDSPGYLADFQSFSKGQSTYFPPGYPLLLGMVGSISGSTLGRWITLTQHGMVILAGVWIFFLLRSVIPDELAMVGGLLAGAIPSSLIIPQTVMSESPTLFAMVGALYFAVRSAETGRLLFAILAGFLTGWAGTMRVVPLAALIPSLCLVYIGVPAKRRFLLLGVTGAVTAGVVLLPVLWIWLGSGRPMLSDSVGFHLFNRVVTEQKLLDEEGPATRLLLTLLEGKNPRGFDHSVIRMQGRVRELSYPEVENLFRKVALEGIRKDPWGYLIYSPPLAWKVLLSDPSGWIPAWGDTISSFPRLENPPPLAFTASSLAQRQNLERAHRVLWPILCWAAIAGASLGLLLPQRNLILSLAWVPIGYLLSSASVEYFSPRYNIPIVPFVAALAMIPLGLNLNQLISNIQELLTGREEVMVLINRAGVAIAFFVSILQGILFAVQTPYTIYAGFEIGLAIATILFASWQFFAKADRGIWVLMLLCCLQLGIFATHLAVGPPPWQFWLLIVAIALVYGATVLAVLLASLKVVAPSTALLIAFALATAAFMIQTGIEMKARSQDKKGTGSIAEAMAKWNLSVYDGNQATLVSSHDSPKREVLRVDIKKADTQTGWHIQLNQAPLKVATRQRYSVSFQARADSSRNVFLGFARAHDPWSDLGLYRSIALSPEWHSFQEEFVATADDDNARILFDLGGNNASAEFADVKLYRLGDT